MSRFGMIYEDPSYDEDGVLCDEDGNICDEDWDGELVPVEELSPFATVNS